MKLIDFFGYFLFGFILGLLVTSLIAAKVDEELRREAIEKGYAEYNQTTGDWQWKEKEGSE